MFKGLNHEDVFQSTGIAALNVVFMVWLEVRNVYIW